MKTVTINLPDPLNLTPQETINALAARLYEMGKLSLGQAAEVADLSKRNFMELLYKYGVSVFNFPHDELVSDIKNAKDSNI